VLIIFAGLPGVGKTSIARELSRRRQAEFLRIDTIEQVVASSEALIGLDLGDLGYQVAYALATENLRLGRTVIADSVNPIGITRDAWRAAAEAAGAIAVEVEVICSDAGEHRRRVETRQSDIAGLKLPTWPEVEAREYHAWPRGRVVIDTAGRSLEACVAELEAALSAI
jgi:predicted kinase